MRDDGTRGDVRAHDRAFSIVFNVLANEVGVRRVRVAATFAEKGGLVSVTSAPTGLFFGLVEPLAITSVVEAYVASLPDGGPPPGDLSHPGVIVGAVPADIASTVEQLTGSEEMVTFQVGSLVLLGLAVPNVGALAGAIALMDLLDGAGVETRSLRSALAAHAFHRNGLEAGNMALTGTDVAVTFLPGTTWYGGGLPRPAIYLVINNTTQTHTILSDSIMEDLIAQKFFAAAGPILDSATTVVHELLHAMIFRSGCFSGSPKAEESLVITLEGLVGATVNVANLTGSTQEVAEMQRQLALAEATAAGGSNCVALLGLAAPRAIVVDGDPGDWTGISPLIVAPTLGDLPGTERVRLSVTNDDLFVYFLLEFENPVIPPADFNFRAIHINLDTDRSPNTGCQTIPSLVGAELAILTDVFPNGQFQGFLGDFRDCGAAFDDFPGTLTAAIGDRFYEAAIPISVLRLVTPGLTAFNVQWVFSQQVATYALK